MGLGGEGQVRAVSRFRIQSSYGGRDCGFKFKVKASEVLGARATTLEHPRIMHLETIASNRGPRHTDGS